MDVAVENVDRCAASYHQSACAARERRQCGRRGRRAVLNLCFGCINWLYQHAYPRFLWITLGVASRILDFVLSATLTLCVPDSTNTLPLSLRIRCRIDSSVNNSASLPN